MSLRRNSSILTPETFESTQTAIFSSLKQSEALCARVFPVEMTHVIRDKIQIEFDLARNGLAVVRACHELSEHANSMSVLQQSIDAYGTGPLAAIRSLIHNSLTKLESVHGRYASALLASNSPHDCTFYQLPGVSSALHNVGSLTLDEDEYDLLPRLRRIAKAWSHDCPILITERTTHPAAGTLLMDDHEFATDAAGVPLQPKYTKGEPVDALHKEMFHTIFKDLNEQVYLMKLAVDGAATGDEESKIYLKAVYRQYNLPEIKSLVYSLIDPAELPIGDTHSTRFHGKNDWIAWVDHVKKITEISPMFYDNSVEAWEKTLTLLHEASHFFKRTVDYWEPDPKNPNALIPVKTEDVKGREKSLIYCGIRLQYFEVDEKAPTILHKSAEHLGVFGYVLKHGSFPRSLAVRLNKRLHDLSILRMQKAKLKQKLRIVIPPPDGHHDPSTESTIPDTASPGGSNRF
ncbi:hypothetical protein CVT24_001967 [Panaeolus cyanescens]|uniref:Uncharacterized protein n=1 Tax=Panaeolus cyanescens TaxID=181874 RepID=A0A409YHP2_9AGAR|nr:hypothetical protein CVT24_001967 [Panaeolus cyanescens]